MHNLVEQLYGNGSLLVLWAGILFHFIIPLPEKAHPVYLWQRFAALLADKVNKPHNYYQTRLSGSLATLLMLFPALILLLALKPLVWHPQLYQLALLILALGWREQERLSHQLVQSFAIEDKDTMRSNLSDMIKRKTSSLSLVGLGKASVETMVIGHARNVIAVLFWYGVAGGVGAFMFRLLTELNRTWSPSLRRFKPFGNTASVFLYFCELIPLRLYALLLLIGKQGLSAIGTIRQQSAQWPSPSTGWLLAVVGCKMNLSLGGPAIYDGIKMLRAKLGGHVIPAAIHLAQLKRLLMIRTTIWILLESIILLSVFQGV